MSALHYGRALNGIVTREYFDSIGEKVPAALYTELDAVHGALDAAAASTQTKAPVGA